ncbi:hypothetical protein [Bounagaea algeriensis]
MGLLDFFRGIKRPDGDVPVLPPEQVRSALLGVNRPTAPFVVREGGDGEPDLVAEWRIVDAQWRQVFAKAGLSKAFRVSMRLDPENREVRAVDDERSVDWVSGVPHLSVKAEAFRGRKWESSWSSEHAFTEYGQFGEVYNYRFNTGELKKPLKNAVTRSGWTWRSAAFSEI